MNKIIGIVLILVGLVFPFVLVQTLLGIIYGLVFIFLGVKQIIK